MRLKKLYRRSGVPSVNNENPDQVYDDDEQKKPPGYRIIRGYAWYALRTLIMAISGSSYLPRSSSLSRV
jgi:hypothetical protein